MKGFAPLVELQDYARQLSSITGGQGSYTIESGHYEVVPANEQQKVLSNTELVEELVH
ncbi:MAG: elongation factor G [Porticoccaceae bacterium]